MNFEINLIFLIKPFSLQIFIKMFFWSKLLQQQFTFPEQHFLNNI